MTTTGMICCIAMIVIGITDAVLVSMGGIDASISRWTQVTAFHAPFFTLMIGYLLGHWLSPMDRGQEKEVLK